MLPKLPLKDEKKRRYPLVIKGLLHTMQSACLRCAYRRYTNDNRHRLATAASPQPPPRREGRGKVTVNPATRRRRHRLSPWTPASRKKLAIRAYPTPFKPSLLRGGKINEQPDRQTAARTREQYAKGAKPQAPTMISRRKTRSPIRDHAHARGKCRRSMPGATVDRRSSVTVQR